ncbi:HAD family hydrolase [Tomitella fengzijianii]|uniref:HAD family hydrolase n=1 Tax=Tomitella fengzijianii TaxID=2597660 RepID=A0A516WZE4_9ACTN|nr:HAD family hydrolase [Tomitella fengzijianii]QDQ96226.1 HAD family hydrolase [Tomitella fengzijianii]
MVELVAFDIAGTVMDEGGMVYEVLRESVERKGVTVTEEQFLPWTGMEKRTAIDNLLRLGRTVPTETMVDDAFAWFSQELVRRYRETPPQPFPGVEELFANLRGCGTKVALTTGFTRELTDALLAGLGWTVGDGDPDATLDAVCAGDEVEASRPHPDMIHAVMRSAGVESASAVIAVGDTLADLDAAQNAGAIGVGVTTGACDRAALETRQHRSILDAVVELWSDPVFEICADAV